MRNLKKGIKALLVMSVLAIFVAGCSCLENKKRTSEASPTPTKALVKAQEAKAEEPVEIMASLKGSTFKNNRSELTPEGKNILDHNVQTMKDNPKLKVRVAGHTSASGSAEANQRLSEKRAEAVKTYMVEKGVASERLSTVGHGSSRPAVHEPKPNLSNTQEAAMNRRVELEIVEK